MKQMCFLIKDYRFYAVNLLERKLRKWIFINNSHLYLNVCTRDAYVKVIKLFKAVSIAYSRVHITDHTTVENIDIRLAVQ